MRINRPVLGSGTLHFGDFDIEVKDVKFETMTWSIGEASEAAFTTHNFEVIQRKEREEVEKEKRDELCSIEVVFDSGGRIYEYLIDSDAFWAVNIGDQYFILNEAGYDYRNAKVTVKKWNEWPSEAATKRIIALRKSSRKGLWIDDGFVANNHPRQKMIDQWIEKTNAGDIATNAIAEKVKEVKYGFTDSITSSLSALSEKVDNLQEAFNNTSSMMTITADKMTFSTLPTQTFKKEYKAYFSNDNDNNKGEDKMNIFGNIEFGKVNHRNTYAMTLKGLAYLRSDGTGERQKVAYVQYDPKTESIEDVTPFVLDSMDVRDFVYKMPVATSSVKKGDIILDCSNPVFVKEVKGSTLTVVDPYSCEVKSILAAKNAFGFNFVTKIVNLMDSFNLEGSANAENPFGNILPLMLLSKDSDVGDMLPLMLMSNGNFNSEDLMSNPMMMYFLMKDGKSNDMLPLLFMSNSGLFGAPTKEVPNEEV